MDPIWAEGNGFRALVESYAVEPRLPSHPVGMPQALGCLALVGGRDAVRAILAHLLTRGMVDLLTPTGTIRAWPGHERGGWSLRLATLPDDGRAGQRRGRRTTHGLVLPKTALRLDDPLAPDRFTLVVPPAGDDWSAWTADTPLEPPPDSEWVYAAFGHQVQARVAVPFHPAWTAWLWRQLIEAGQIQRLIGRGPQVFRCSVPPDRFSELIRGGCEGGHLAALVGTAQAVDAVQEISAGNTDRRASACMPAPEHAPSR
jgi:hypothetical protein